MPSTPDENNLMEENEIVIVEVNDDLETGNIDDDTKQSELHEAWTIIRTLANRLKYMETFYSELTKPQEGNSI